MPYLIISVYHRDHGELYEPYIFQIGNKIKNYQDRKDYQECINSIKNDLMEGYSGCEFEDIYEIEEFIVNKISKL